MGHERKAAICEKGHTSTFVMEINEDYDGDPFCKKCGSKVLTNCPSCKSHISGRSHYTGVIDGTPFTPSNNCGKCGKPYPWNNSK